MVAMRGVDLFVPLFEEVWASSTTVFFLEAFLRSLNGAIVAGDACIVTRDGDGDGDS